MYGCVFVVFVAPPGAEEQYSISSTMGTIADPPQSRPDRRVFEYKRTPVKGYNMEFRIPVPKSDRLVLQLHARPVTGDIEFITSLYNSI